MERDNTTPTDPESAGREIRWDTGLYDGRHAFVWKAGADLIDLLDPKPGERILDLGCGTGHLAHAIAERGAHVLGLDASPEMVSAAREAYPDLAFEVARGEDFAVPEPFDAVFSNAAIHWMPQPARVVANISRALKPGGRFVAEFGGKDNIRHVMESLVAAASALLHDVRLVSPWYFPSIGEYATILEAAGLETRSALLFDRPSILEGEDGLREWYRMFAGGLLEQIPEDRRAAVVETAEDIGRPALYHDGAWHADYRRLRVFAVKAG